MEEILQKIEKAVYEGDCDSVKALCERALKENISPSLILEKGLIAGLRKIGEEWARGEAFLPSVLSSAAAMKEGISIIEPEMIKRKEKAKYLGKVIIGTVKGDIHDIGKNLVAVMLSAEGFEVHDLGVDVPENLFVEKVREIRPDIIGLSALMTSTMIEQKTVIDALKRAGLRDFVKVMVGGAPVTARWAEEIGADGYAENAYEAVKLAKRLVGRD
ncbi:MAG: corrinoid protein [Candidatus Bathyarchaeia archaeon]